MDRAFPDNDLAQVSSDSIVPDPLALEMQLFDMRLFRLWRTGGIIEQYLPEEDEEIDVS